MRTKIVFIKNKQPPQKLHQRTPNLQWTS